MTDPKPKIGAMLLAAGGSSRFGSPKQLAELNGKPLIRFVAESLVHVRCSPTVAVLGANADLIRPVISDLDMVPVMNPDWHTGLSSSIRVGLDRSVELMPDLDAVVITLADQPFVTSRHINSLIDDFVVNRSNVVAAKYGETIGVPAVFAREMFAKLRDLSGDRGARELIRSQGAEVRVIVIESSSTDIDTPEDLAAVSKN